MAKPETFILSLGGSLISRAEGIQENFLKEFKDLIVQEMKKGKRFLIICGGGNTARTYQQAAKNIASAKSLDLDWVGIQASRLNAYLLKAIFGPLANEGIILDPEQKINNKRNLVVFGAGFKPGRSTDYMAALVAQNQGAKTMINLSNIDYVYNKDPKKFKDAQIIKEIKWSDFRKIVGNTWTPGLNMPFDPIASKLCQKNKTQVLIMNGSKLDKVKDFLNGRGFVGTLIK